MANMRSVAAVLASVLFAGVQGIAAQQGPPSGPPGQQGGGQGQMMGFPYTKEVHVHGWLMWVSMGFLFPLGTLLIRYSKNQSDPAAPTSPSRGKIFFYAHIVVQVTAVITATTGVSYLIEKVGSTFDYTHMRLGLAVLIMAMMQPFIGIFRPAKGKPARPFWYLIHWTFGTGVLFLGVINTYLGIVIYEQITQTSIRSLNIAFSVQIAVMAFLYLMQDRWSYIVGQSNHRPFAHKQPENGVNNI